MLKLENLFELVLLGRRIQELRDSLENQDGTVGDSARNAVSLKHSLTSLLANKALPLTASKDAVTKLLASIEDAFSARAMKEWEARVNRSLAGTILGDAETFELALSEELKQVPVFFVERKGNFDRDALLNDAAGGFSSRAVSLFDDFVRQEIGDAGKCLAFARSTASGFHILRAVEYLLKTYVHAATGSLPPERQLNWGSFVQILEKNDASQTLIGFLNILRRHRNPLMHPVDQLDLEEAIDIFGISQSVINAVAKDIHDRNMTAVFTASLSKIATLS